MQSKKDEMEEVYIINTSSFLPNTAITNDVIEEYMGFINGTVSRTKNLILRNNKIKERYYAIDKDGNSTHSNAEMVSLAIRKLLENNIDPIELLACGTSSPDQLMPSHGVMVHGELPELGSIEVVSPSGVCCSGMHALKYSFLSIKTGDKKNTLQLSLDIFNFTNLINKDWGVRKFIRGNVSPLQTVSTSDNNPVFSFVESLLEYDDAGNPIALDVEQIDDQGLQSARWQMQVGLRYIFN